MLFDIISLNIMDNIYLYFSFYAVYIYFLYTLCFYVFLFLYSN